MQIGMMLFDAISHPATCKPEDVLATVKRNQMEYYFSDILMRGKYPNYAFRFFEENNLDIQFGENDEEDLNIQPISLASLITIHGSLMQRASSN